MISAGALIKSIKTDRYLFILRSKNSTYPSKWGLVGGKVHHDEKIIEGLTREIFEEIGFIPEFKKILPFNQYISLDKKFCYHSVLMTVENEFVPILNQESDGYAWTYIDTPPKPLHPRLAEVITSKVLIDSIKKFI